jgi:cation diffusion facilitator CzcD-associated flavoprotein CzcO
MDERIRTGVIVVGAGFSGLGMAVQLRKDGREDFIVLEKADDVGGTWRDNTYPGCACDIQSHLYSFSFEQNPGWTRSFSAQQEIWDYLRRTTDKYDLRRHIQFGVEVTGARWDPDEHRWYVSTTSGAEYLGQYLVAGVGALHIPKVPDLPGMDTFRGRSFHSAQWAHDYDLTGKRVAVVGTGASAVQFVPQIAGKVAELYLFQRTAPWIMPKPDHAIPPWVRILFTRVPGAQRAYRSTLYWLLESRALGFNGRRWMLGVGQRIATRHLRRSIADPVLRAKLTPDYAMGCKRVLLANDFYPALTQGNVHLVTDGIAEVTASGIVDRTGVRREVDAIIFGTGFHVTDAFDDLGLIGRDGRDLAKDWRTNGMQTHLGMAVAGYPNLFFLLGPNTGLGHNSVVLMIESQVRYVAEAITLVERERAAAIEVRQSVQSRFQADIQRKLADGIWSQGGCRSWYLDAHGVNRTIWPGFAWRYWMRTRTVDPRDYQLTGACPVELGRCD